MMSIRYNAIDTKKRSVLDIMGFFFRTSKYNMNDAIPMAME